MADRNIGTITLDDGGQTYTWTLSGDDDQMFLGFPSDYPRPDVAVWLQSPVQQDSNLESTTLYIDGQGTVTVDNYYSANFNRPSSTSFARSLLSSMVLGSAGGAHMQTMTGARMSHLDINRASQSEVNDAEILGTLSIAKLGVITPHTCLIKPDPANIAFGDGGVAGRPSPTALIAAHNDYRAERGLSVLESNGALTQAIAAHVQWMVANDTFSHTGEGGSSPGDRAQASGFTDVTGDGLYGVGENIAAGQISVDAAMTAWDNSPPHHANLNDPRWTQIGVAIATCAPGSSAHCSGGYWWGVLFGYD